MKNMIDYFFILQTISVFNISLGACGFSVYLTVTEVSVNFKVPTTVLPAIEKL
ncbi:hypothetical protein [Brachyspira sp.]|uniref:hypothetical protein n=1 Tax=Brachyspira sp. TaxID=1977261 RepID=UPI00345C162E